MLYGHNIQGVSKSNWHKSRNQSSPFAYTSNTVTVAMKTAFNVTSVPDVGVPQRRQVILNLQSILDRQRLSEANVSAHNPEKAPLFPKLKRAITFEDRSVADSVVWGPYKTQHATEDDIKALKAVDVGNEDIGSAKTPHTPNVNEYENGHLFRSPCAYKNKRGRRARKRSQGQRSDAPTPYNRGNSPRPFNNSPQSKQGLAAGLCKHRQYRRMAVDYLNQSCFMSLHRPKP